MAVSTVPKPVMITVMTSRSMLVDAAHQLEAVHARHLEIGEDEVERLVAEAPRARYRAPHGGAHAEAFELEEVAQDVADDRLVVDDEDPRWLRWSRLLLQTTLRARACPTSPTRVFPSVSVDNNGGSLLRFVRRHSAASNKELYSNVPPAHNSPRGPFAAALALALSGCAEDTLFALRTKTDEFVQNAAARVDILWVVDNSESMAQEQTGLGESFDTFIDNLVQSGVDYHVGVVATDATETGVLHQADGMPAFIDSTTEDPVAAFKENVKVGTTGARWERGFEVAAKVLGKGNDWNPSMPEPGHRPEPRLPAPRALPRPPTRASAARAPTSPAPRTASATTPPSSSSS